MGLDSYRPSKAEKPSDEPNEWEATLSSFRLETPQKGMEGEKEIDLKNLTEAAARTPLSPEEQARIKAEAKSIITDTPEKIKANQELREKLDSVRRRFGRAAVRTSELTSEPSEEGLDPKEQLEESARRSEARVKDQIDQLRRGLNKKE